MTTCVHNVLPQFVFFYGVVPAGGAGGPAGAAGGADGPDDGTDSTIGFSFLRIENIGSLKPPLTKPAMTRS